MAVKKRTHRLLPSWPTTEAAAVDTTPEHTKMAPHVEANWAIRDFLIWCVGRNVRLVHDGADGITRTVTHRVQENLIARFRGVDPEAYRAESDMLLKKYEHVLPKLPKRLQADEGALPLMEEFDTGDAQVIKIIEVLDSLRVPVDAGRMVCAKALADQGIAAPETILLARAIKFRKAMYGVRDNYMGRFASVDPRRKVHTPAEVEANEESVISALMAKLGGGADAAQD